MPLINYKVRGSGGTPIASVVGSGVRTGVVSAAWANGALAHLLDFDDTGFSHPTACILPAALAMAELKQASGADLVTAVCVGLEVFERLSKSGRQFEPELRRRGFHPTSLYGCPAAAAAAGRIARLNARQMGAAMGLGFVAGPLIGGAFGEWSLRAPFLAAAAMNALKLFLDHPGSEVS